MPRLSRATAALIAVSTLAALRAADAFVDNSLPTESFQYRGRNWTVPIQSRVYGYFDWDTVAGCVDYDKYRYYCPGSRKLTITLDDGPSEFTSNVLDTLDAAGVKATFCQLGIHMTPDRESLIRRMADEGHELCIHTENHLHLTQLTTRQIIDEIVSVMDRYKAILGVIPRWFRPPFGEMDMRVRAILDQLGLEALQWNMDSWDWKQNATESGSRLVNAMSTAGSWEWANPAAQSYMVLAHDIHQVTVDQFVPFQIAQAKRQGWKIVAPSSADCFKTTRWIEGGEDVYAQNKRKARGLLASGIVALPIPKDYVDPGSTPGGSGNGVAGIPDGTAISTSSSPSPTSVGSAPKTVLQSKTFRETANTGPTSTRSRIQPVKTGSATATPTVSLGPVVIETESGATGLVVSFGLALVALVNTGLLI